MSLFFYRWSIISRNGMEKLIDSHSSWDEFVGFGSLSEKGQEFPLGGSWALWWDKLGHNNPGHVQKKIGYYLVATEQLFDLIFFYWS